MFSEQDWNCWVRGHFTLSITLRDDLKTCAEGQDPYWKLMLLFHTSQITIIMDPADKKGTYAN